jgi:hypothetical protein
MDSIKDLKEKLRSTRPAEWDKFPDIELYKDQVLSYMQRQLMPSEDEELLTGAMINNYIKAGALPRPNGKKYGKEHLAYLTAICALKPVMSVNDLEYLLKKQNGTKDAQEFYELLCSNIDTALNEAAEGISDDLQENEIPEYILSIALKAAGLRIVCEKLLLTIREKDIEADKQEKEKKTQNGAKKDKKGESVDK